MDMVLRRLPIDERSVLILFATSVSCNDCTCQLWICQPREFPSAHYVVKYYCSSCFPKPVVATPSFQTYRLSELDSTYLYLSSRPHPGYHGLRVPMFDAFCSSHLSKSTYVQN